MLTRAEKPPISCTTVQQSTEPVTAPGTSRSHFTFPSTSTSASTTFHPSSSATSYVHRDNSSDPVAAIVNPSSYSGYTSSSMAVCASSPVPTPARYVFHQPSELFSHASTVPASYPQPPQPIYTTVHPPRTNSQTVLPPGADRLVQHVSSTESGASRSPLLVPRVPRSPISSRTRSRLGSSEQPDERAGGLVDGSLVIPQTISWSGDHSTVRPLSVATAHLPVSSITAHSLLQPAALSVATGHQQISAPSLPSSPSMGQPPLQSSSVQSPTDEHYTSQQRVHLSRHYPSSGPDANMSHQEVVISAAAPTTLYYVDPTTGRPVLTGTAPAIQSAPSPSVSRRQSWTGQLVGGHSAPSSGAVVDAGVPVDSSSPIGSGPIRMALGSSSTAMVGRSSPTTGAVVEHGSSVGTPLNAPHSASTFPPGNYILTGVSGVRGILPSYIGMQRPTIPTPMSIEVQQPHNRVSPHLSHLPPPPYSYHLARRLEFRPSLKSSSFENMRSDGGNVRPRSPMYLPAEVQRAIHPQGVTMAVSPLRQLETRNSVSSSSTLRERDYICPQPNSLSVSPQATSQAVLTTTQAVIPFTSVPMNSIVTYPKPPAAAPTQCPAKQKPANEPLQGSASSPIIIEDSEEPLLSTKIKKPPTVSHLQQSDKPPSQAHQNDGENELQAQVRKEPTEFTIDGNDSADMELENRISPDKSTKIANFSASKSQEERATQESPVIVESNEPSVKEQSQEEKMTHESRVIVESAEPSVKEQNERKSQEEKMTHESAVEFAEPSVKEHKEEKSQEEKMTYESRAIVESAEPSVTEQKEENQKEKITHESTVIVESSEPSLGKQREEKIIPPVVPADDEIDSSAIFPNTPPLSPNTSSNNAEIAVLASDEPATCVLPESEATKLATPKDLSTSNEEESVTSKERTLHFDVVSTNNEDNGEPEEESEANRLEDVDMWGQDEDQVQDSEKVENDTVKRAKKCDREPHFSVESKTQTITEPLKETNKPFDRTSPGKNAANLQIATEETEAIDDTSNTASGNDMSNNLKHTGPSSTAVRITTEQELSGIKQQPQAEDQSVACEPSMTGQHNVSNNHRAPEADVESVEQVATVNTSPTPLMQQESALPITPVQEAQNDASSSPRVTPGILKHTSQFDTPTSSTSRRRRVQFANNPVIFNSPKEDSEDTLRTPRHCMSHIVCFIVTCISSVICHL